MIATSAVRLPRPRGSARYTVSPSKSGPSKIDGEFEPDTKRKAEDEATLVKVAGCPSMSVLGLTAATGWGGVCYVPFSTPAHAAAAVERINRQVAGAVASVVDEAPPGVDVAAPSKKPRGGPASLLLKGIPSSWDWKYVKDLCHNKDPTVYLPGRTPAPRRGRVTVEFATREQAEEAAARINGDLPSVVPTAGITAEVV